MKHSMSFLGNVISSMLYKHLTQKFCIGWKPTAEAFLVAYAHCMYLYLFTPIVFLSYLLPCFTSDSHFIGQYYQ